MKVLVLGGGDSPEREVSLRSAKAVADAAREAGFEVEEYDPIDGYNYFDSLSKDTIVLPILHGVNGEDGVVQAELEKRSLPFLGADAAVSTTCFDKWKVRQSLETAGLPMPRGFLVNESSYFQHEMSGRPHVLKVRHGGSSIGTLIARQAGGADKNEVGKVFALDKEAIIEQLIEGPEITVPVLDQKALPVIEIVPPEGLEFDYENKYNGLTAEICPPKSVDQSIQIKAQRLAEEIHKLMRCRHISRTDFMVDSDGKIYALEINTIPGLNNQSLTPKSAAVAGYSMPQLVEKFVEMVKRDYKL